MKLKQTHSEPGACSAWPGLVVLLAPLLAAAALRLYFYFYLMNSPFPYYSYLKGLDMIKLLRWGIEGASGIAPGKDIFIYSISVLCRLFTERNALESVIIFQFALGILTVLLTVLSAWYISGNRYTALFSGMILAVYAPKLIYEGFVLKSTMTAFLYAFGFFMTMYSARRNYEKAALALSGFSYALILLIRFDGILIVLSFIVWISTGLIKGRKRILPALFALLTGFFLTLLVFYLANHRASMAGSYLKPDTVWLKYIYTKGTEAGATTVNTGIDENMLKDAPVEINAGSLVIYLEKASRLFSVYEVPDNVNYYFVRECLPDLKCLPGPVFLLPLALAGLAVILFMRLKYKGLLYLGIICVAVPIIAFLPLSRYKVALSPFLCIAAGCFVSFAISKLRELRFVSFSSAVVLYGVVLAVELYSSGSDVLRVTDFIAYGRATNLKFPQDATRSLNAFIMAYEANPSDKPAVLNYVMQLMNCRMTAQAEKIMRKSYKEHPDDIDMLLAYVSILFAMNDNSKAGEILLKIESDRRFCNDPYFLFHLAEYYYRAGDMQKAEKYFAIVQSGMNGNQQNLAVVRARLDEIRRKIK